MIGHEAVDRNQTLELGRRSAKEFDMFGDNVGISEHRLPPENGRVECDSSFAEISVSLEPPGPTRSHGFTRVILEARYNTPAHLVE
jgi:hypothetical protein